MTTDLLHRLGIDAGRNAQGMKEEGFNLADGERLIRIEITRLTGKHVVVYGQTEVTRDLIDAAPGRGLEIVFQAGDVALHDVHGAAPSVTYAKDGANHRIEADFICGCDGFHGPSRKLIPGAAREFEREYPFGWLGILADVPPCHPELIYVFGVCGFALVSLCSSLRCRFFFLV